MLVIGLHNKQYIAHLCLIMYFQGVDLFTEVMILSAPDKQLKDQENRINKLDLEGELVHLFINVFLGSA